MQIVNVGKERSCTFCGKSQRVARSLIESPDHCTYICDECVTEPSRLKLAAEEHENRTDASATPPSRFRRFLQEHLGPTQMRCSFCQKRLRSRDSHVPATHPVLQVQICSDCLVVCRQILSDEAQRKRSEARNS
jgi:ATP-dependent protease Clp ATPase subunit